MIVIELNESQNKIDVINDMTLHQTLNHYAYLGYR